MRWLWTEIIGSFVFPEQLCNRLHSYWICNDVATVPTGHKYLLTSPIYCLARACEVCGWCTKFLKLQSSTFGKASLYGLVDLLAPSTNKINPSLKSGVLYDGVIFVCFCSKLGGSLACQSGKMARTVLSLGTLIRISYKALQTDALG